MSYNDGMVILILIVMKIEIEKRIDSESESLMEIQLKFCNFHPETFANLKKGEIPEHY